MYGGFDGANTTFAIVSGVTGAHLPAHVIVILGMANVIADGLAMGAGNYLATRAEQEEHRRTEAIEHQHIEDFPHGEREEVREIFRRYGIAGDLLDRLVDAITANREQWVRTMLQHEYGLATTVRSPWRASAATFMAFVLCGLVPLFPYVLGLARAFPIAAVATALVFAGIGILKSRWSLSHWFRSGVETLLVGCAAAAISYGIGALLRDIAA